MVIRVLHIKVPAQEFYDESNNEFIELPEQTLTMEHSLISISKWEAKWKKPYLSKAVKKTREETFDYLRCMTVYPTNVNPLVYRALTKENIAEIVDYIENPMTATTIHHYERVTPKKEILTSELIYYYMIAQNIPVEFEKWHINRLLTLIEVCAIKNNPKGKKMSKSAIAKQNRALNNARRAKYKTRG